VLGGELVLFAVFLLPMIARMPKILYAVVDASAISVLLLLIQVISQGDWGWFLLMGIPITMLTSVMCWFFSIMATPAFKLPILVRFSLALACIGLLVVAIEFFIGLYQHIVAWPTWSLYVLFPLPRARVFAAAAQSPRAGEGRDQKEVLFLKPHLFR
jgi:hypothetical protein